MPVLAWGTEDEDYINATRYEAKFEIYFFPLAEISSGTLPRHRLHEHLLGGRR